MRRLLISFVFILSNMFGSGLMAQSDGAGPLPATRFLTQPDTDHFGADLQALFDTSLSACQKACESQSACVGFVYNQRSNACFSKAEMRDPSPFVGALSVRKLPVNARLAARAAERAARLQGIYSYDLDAARKLAEEIGTRYPFSGQPLDGLISGAQQFYNGNNATLAARWMGEAVALSDEADLWVDYARFTRAMPTDNSRETRRNMSEALAAALNGYLRADAAPLQATALTEAALLLEKLNRGRDMLSVLRLADDIAPGRRSPVCSTRRSINTAFASPTRGSRPTAPIPVCVWNSLKRSPRPA